MPGRRRLPTVRRCMMVHPTRQRRRWRAGGIEPPAREAG